MAATAARGRARDVARWLRVLQAPGTHVPAISLLRDTMRALHSGAEPQQLVDACRRAIDAGDRQIVAERIGGTDPSPERSMGAVIERDGLQSSERRAICALLREQLIEIVATVRELGGSG